MVSSDRGSIHGGALLNSKRRGSPLQGVVVQTRDGSSERHLHVNGTTFKVSSDTSNSSRGEKGQRIIPEIEDMKGFLELSLTKSLYHTPYI